MKNIIIGIHGLAPKPPAEILQDWWHTSILEGLKLNHDTAPDVPFELAYWADIRNQTVPISSLDEHYEKANPPLSRFNHGLKDKIKAKLKKKFGNAHEKAKIIPGLGKAAEELLNIKFDDLEAYYEEDHIRRAERVREKAAAAGATNVSFERTTLEALAATDESLDVVLGLSILHLLPNREGAIARAWRLLKPGGVFISSTACLADSHGFLRPFLAAGRWLGLLPFVKFFSRAELEAEFTAAGFTIEDLLPHAEGMTADRKSE